MRGGVRQFTLAVLSGTALVALVVAVLSLLNSGAQGQNGLAPAWYGWVVPLGSVVVILGVIWLLLAKAPSGDEGAARFRQVVCPTCGREVLDDWRLCPYCGGRLVPVSDEAGADTG